MQFLRLLKNFPIHHTLICKSIPAMSHVRWLINEQQWTPQLSAEPFLSAQDFQDLYSRLTSPMQGNFILSCRMLMINFAFLPIMVNQESPQSISDNISQGCNTAAIYGLLDAHLLPPRQFYLVNQAPPREQIANLSRLLMDKICDSSKTLILDRFNLYYCQCHQNERQFSVRAHYGIFRLTVKSSSSGSSSSSSSHHLFRRPLSPLPTLAGKFLPPLKDNNEDDNDDDNDNNDNESRQKKEGCRRPSTSAQLSSAMDVEKDADDDDDQRLGQQQQQRGRGGRRQPGRPPTTLTLALRHHNTVS